MKVLLGGGTGFIGKHLCGLLTKKGHKVTVVSRKAGPERVTWDQLKHEGFRQKYEAIVNLAGENIMNPLYRLNDAFKQRLEESRLDTSRLLASLIASSPDNNKPDVWVSSSAIGFYPPDPSIEYTEESRGGRGDYFADLCRRWEESAMIDKPHIDTSAAAANQKPADVNDVRHVIVRIGVVLGKGGGVVARSYWPFFFGLGARIGSGKQYFPWVHLQDIASIFLFAIENKDVKGVINGTAPDLVTNGEFTSAFASALHRPTFVCMPEFAMNAAFGAERASMMTRGQKVVPAKLLRLGYEFQYPDIEAACKELVS